MFYSEALIWTLYASNVRTNSLFQKIIKNLFDLKSSKNTFEQGYPIVLCLFEGLNVLFWKLFPIYSFIYCFSGVQFFFKVDNFPSLKHCHARVWSCFPLIIAIFMNLVLYARNFFVVFNRIVGTYWLAHRFR